MTDADPIHRLVLEARNGDSAAFRSLVKSCHALVYRVCYRMLGNAEDAQETVQETFIKVWKNLHVFDQRTRFTTWVYTIASHTALDHIRARDRRRKVSEPFEEARGITTDDAYGRTMTDHADLEEILTVALARLSPVQRLVFALRDLEDLSIEEVTRVSGLSAGSVKTNLSFARRALRQILDKEYDLQGAQP